MGIDVIGFPAFAGEGDSQERLELFLRSVRAFLGGLISSNEDPLGNEVFHEVFLDDLRSAWAEVQEHFESAMAGIAKVPNEDLHRHGLDGSQLRLKFSVVRFYFGRFLKMGREALKSVLDPIDVVLNSVATVVPAVGAIVEIKDTVKSCVR
jgi:hypothetical protein